MVNRLDDLAPLFDRGPAGLKFRQGTVQEWNPETGENTVTMGDALLRDVPILNTGESIALRSGHVVGMLGSGGTYCILGRITLPGSSDFASASVSANGTWGSANDFDLRNDVYLQISGRILVPSWANRAMAFVNANMSITNTGPISGDYVNLEAVLDNGPGRPGYPEAATNQLIFVGGSAQRLIDVSTKTELMVGCRWYTQEATWPAHYANIANFDAFAVFFSVT